jgi:hypothetical protein
VLLRYLTLNGFQLFLLPYLLLNPLVQNLNGGVVVELLVDLVHYFLVVPALLLQLPNIRQEMLRVILSRLLIRHELLLKLLLDIHLLLCVLYLVVQRLVLFQQVLVPV